MELCLTELCKITGNYIYDASMPFVYFKKDTGRKTILLKHLVSQSFPYESLVFD